MAVHRLGWDHDTGLKVFVMLLMLLFCSMTYADDAVEIDGIWYTLNSQAKTAAVTKSSSSEYTGDIVIPETISYNNSQYTVTSIGKSAFSGCRGLTSVTIPNSVTSIGEWAFYDCRGLTSVTIPNSVTSIEEYVFAACSSLTSVTIPNSVTSIGDYAFFDCYRLTSVTIPDSVTSIGDYAFQYCNDLTSMTIGNSVTSIGNKAFYDCSRLTSVTIPNSVTSIGDEAFERCSRLTSVTISNSVTSIGKSAFSGCSGLTSVYISDIAAWCQIKFSDYYSNPLYYAHHLYLGEKEIEHLDIPNSVTSIGNSAFYGCSGLTSVTIPNSVTSIGNKVFFGCIGLTSVHISDIAAWCQIEFDNNDSNPLSYAHHLFLGDKEIEHLDIPNSVTSIRNYAFYGCSGLTSVSIPNSVTIIREYAFNCSGLTSVTIPNSVTSIEYSAFWDCFGLTSIISQILEPFEIENGVFSESTYTDAVLTVPAGTKPKYEATSGWKGFKNIVEEGVQKLQLSASPSGGQVEKGTTVTLMATYDGSVVSGCDIYYTLDDTTPTKSSTKYTSSGITLNSDCTLKAVAMKDGYEDSEPLTAVYAIKNSNASGDGSLENPFNAVAAINKAKELAVGEVSSQDYYVKGKISSIKYYYSAQYGTAAFNISDDGLDKDQFYVYGSYYLENKPWVDGNPQIEIGDDVILYGKMMNYNGTLEMADRLNYVYSHNGRIKLAPKLILSASPEGGQVEKGTTVTLKVEADGEIVSGCDIYYTLDGTTPTKSSTKYTSSGITLNSDCTLKAIAMKDGYEDSELLTAVYAIKNSNASGDGSLENPFNAVAAINKAKELAVGEVSSQDYYVKGKISSIKYYYSAQYGTAAFNISDDGLDKDQFYVYGSYYLENKPWVDGNPQIEIGDDVILYGKMMNYNGTLEMADRLNYVYSHNGRIKLAPKLILSASPEGGQVEKGTTVTLKVEADGATVSSCDIYYTLDGTKPTNGSTKYTSSGITITETCTMQAIAKKDGYEDGELEARYEVVETPDPGKDVTWTDPETAVAYTLNTSGTTATVSGVDGNKAQGDVVIPSKITYDGKTYQVTAIDKGVFKSAGNVRSITVPESITEVGKDAFASEGLLALVWNPRQVMQADVLLNEGSGRSKNFLLYCYKDMAPQGVGHVVEMDGSGNNRARNAIVLAEGANFYCPLAFTANVSYTHYFSMHTGLTACEGWESIALPFDVQRVKHSDGRVLRPFGVQRSGSERPFWLYEMKQGGFVKATAIKANTPYIISMPNNEAYLDDYNVEGEVTFEAENATIRPTAQLNSITIQGKGTFQPTFTELRANSTTACLNSSNAQHTATGGEAPGSHFMTNLRAAVPFEAVFDNVPAGVRRIAVSLGGDDTDDIRELSVLRDEEPERIYNLNGQRIESMKHRGLYIVSSAKGRRQGEKARKYVKCR